MKFSETNICGVFKIEVEEKIDERGSFARSWCQKEFSARGLESKLVQCSISFNPRNGTLRGMHFQTEPHAETKLVRCTSGSIYDVVIDLRPESPTFCQWAGVHLSSRRRDMVYIPQRCAHGFLTLEDETEIFYQMSEFYHPELACGVRWNDPVFQITWPGVVQVISQRDQTYPNFEQVKCTC